MEGNIRRKGMLYIQQQRFGKRWKKMWCVLYGESRCSASRLELYEYKQASSSGQLTGACSGADPHLLRRQDSKRVLLLRDCISVEEMELMDCPRDCVSFIVETAEKRFLFAALFTEFRHWVAGLCELAFPMNTAKSGGLDQTVRQQSSRNSLHAQMVENTLYERTDTAGDFPVSVVRTGASNRWQLHGAYILTPEPDRLLLKDPICKEILFIWPYCFIRKFGQDKSTFSFEAGRRCESGEGVFEFATSRADSLFSIINTAISTSQEMPRPCLQPSRSLKVQRAPEPDVTQVNVRGYQVPESMLPPTQGTPPKADRQLKRLTPSFRSLSLNAIKIPNKDLVRTVSSCPPLKHEDREVIYAKVSRQKLIDQVPQEECTCGGGSHALEDPTSMQVPPMSMQVPSETCVNFPQHSAFEALQQPEGRRSNKEHESETEQFSEMPCDHSDQLDAEERADADHIYDDPEGCLADPQWAGACVVYDDPEDVKTDLKPDQGHADLGRVLDVHDDFLYDNVMTRGQ